MNAPPDRYFILFFAPAGRTARRELHKSKHEPNQPIVVILAMPNKSSITHKALFSFDVSWHSKLGTRNLKLRKCGRCSHQHFSSVLLSTPVRNPRRGSSIRTSPQQRSHLVVIAKERNEEFRRPILKDKTQRSICSGFQKDSGPICVSRDRYARPARIPRQDHRGPTGILFSRF